MTLDLDRRAALSALAATGAALSLISRAVAQAPTKPAVPAPATGAYAPVALPFDPATIPGFSPKILVSHHDNNYVGAVTRLNAIEGQIKALDPSTAPGFLLNGLKREESLAMNSMILHEIYFRCLGKGAGKPGEMLGGQIEADFGSFDNWRSQFMAMGRALGGRSGWVVLGWSPRAGRLVNHWAADHTMSLADSHCLVALDMYEHAYHMDFGANTTAYVDAFMAALDWRNADVAFSIAQPT